MKAIVDGLAVEYLDEGEGKIILYLHGWGDTMRTFDRLIAQMPRHRAIRLDLPGFGASEKPPEWRIDDYVHFVRHFLEKVNAAPGVIVGHSLGGRIAIKAVADDGLLHVEKLVLIASAGNARRKTLHNALYFLLAKAGRALTSVWPLTLLRAKLRTRLYFSAKSDYLSSGQMRETFRHVIAEDLMDSAAKIQAPTLLIWGDADDVTPLADGERYHKQIPGARLSVIPSAGHFVHVEKPQDVADAIQSFI